MLAFVLFAVFFILLLLSVPISIALGFSSMVAIMFCTTDSVGVLIQNSFANGFSLMAIPFFILAGNIMARGGVSQRLVNLANCGFGRYLGGLAHVATAACTFFGAISGSAPATTAAIGGVMVEPMTEKGYSKAFSGACVAASGMIGLLIPPSIIMIIYGVLTGTSVAKLFIGGIIPGLLTAAAYMICNHIIAKKLKCPRGDKPAPGETWKCTKEAIWAILMPLIILGGIYGGIFTPTESAVVAVVYGIIVGFWIHRSLTVKDLYNVFLATAKSSAIILFLIATAHCFSFVLASGHIPQTLAIAIRSISQNPTLVLFLICFCLLIVGTFLDNAVAVVLMTPIFFPVVQSLGIDPIFFGVLTVFTLAIGQITPPVGLCLFVACNLAKLKLEEIVVYCVPYIVAALVLMCLFVFFPQLILVLPGMMN
ncbi:TRAP transporter large permease [Desulfovibrio sp.]|uniref:TRAP transporter large permease n=1 Tax=Desulfovibrio sp. TaxID=885 RepID=UPI0023C05324|nr:TRAP transporter large permease [Desulfovibrio sp.]MDE7241740.1 TRAP transporter large permease [Desulfovibrio sp.]